MISQQLLDFIRQQMQMGKQQSEITQQLLDSGWKAEDIAEGFRAISNGAVVPPTGAQIPAASQILKEAWATYKQKLETLAIINAIPVVGFFILGLIGALVGFSIFSVYGHTITPIFSDPTAILVFTLIMIVLSIAMIYVSVWSSVATLFVFKEQSRQLGWKEAYQLSRVKINDFFSTNLLTGLAVMGGFILLIVPGIIFALWFSQVSYIVIEENLKNSAAMSRSKYYIKGRMGQILGKLAYLILITLGFYLILGILEGILARAIGTKSENLNWINQIISIFYTPFAIAYGYQLYRYIKGSRP